MPVTKYIASTRACFKNTLKKKNMLPITELAKEEQNECMNP